MLAIIEYGLEATTSILWLQIVFLAARRDDYDYDCGARQELYGPTVGALNAEGPKRTFSTISKK